MLDTPKLKSFVGGIWDEDNPGTPIYETRGSISALRVAPAGDRVAFLEHPIEFDEAGRVAVLAPGGAPVYLTPVLGVVKGLAWSADGKELWYSAQEEGSRGGLYAVARERAIHRAIARQGQQCDQDWNHPPQSIRKVRRCSPARQRSDAKQPLWKLLH